MCYPSSANKGADQLRGYREADLRLCFRLCRLFVFPWGGSNEAVEPILYMLSDYSSMVNGTVHLVDGGLLSNIPV